MKGVSAEHKASTLFFSFPSMYVLLQSITERLHDQLLINSRTLETAPILETPPFFSLVKHKTGFTFTCWPGRCRAVLAFFPFSVEIRALSRQLIKNTVLVASSNTLKMQMWRHDKIRKSFTEKLKWPRGHQCVCFALKLDVFAPKQRKML